MAEIGKPIREVEIEEPALVPEREREGKPQRQSPEPRREEQPVPVKQPERV